MKRMFLPLALVTVIMSILLIGAAVAAAAETPSQPRPLPNSYPSPARSF